MADGSRVTMALYFLYKSLLRLILEILALILLLTGIGTLILMNDSVNSIRSMIESVINKPIEQCGVMYIDYSDVDRNTIKEFMGELDEEEVIYAYGRMLAESMGDSIPYLTDRLKEYSSNNMKEDDYFDEGLVYGTNPECFDLLDIKLYVGVFKTPEEIDEIVEQENCGVYLGYAYRDIPVGTELEMSNNHKCIVLGILEKGTKGLSQNTFFNSQIYNLNLLVNMDYAVLNVSSQTIGSPRILAFNDNVSFADGAKK